MAKQQQGETQEQGTAPAQAQERVPMPTPRVTAPPLALEPPAQEEEPLVVLAGKIKAAHYSVVASLKAALEHARRAGDFLSLVRSRKDYFGWVKWVQENVGISEATANNYVRIYQKWGELPDAVKQEGNYTDALKALRKKRAPTGAKPPEKPLPDAFLEELRQRMKEHKVRGSVENVAALLATYGITAETYKQQ